MMYFDSKHQTLSVIYSDNGEVFTTAVVNNKTFLDFSLKTLMHPENEGLLIDVL